MASETELTVEVALDEYFKLKAKYEREIATNKKKILNNPSLSNKEKRAEFIKLKPKCINCKRPGGSRFNILFHPENDKDESYREYVAKCGIIVDPCNLDIKIKVGKTELLDDVLNMLQESIKVTKNGIIDDKNKLLFGYITTETALENFDNSKEYVSDLTSLYEQYLQLYSKVVDNPEKRIELDEALGQSYALIDQMKQSIRKYNETDKVQYAKDVAILYEKNLYPLLIKIRNLKYRENAVLFDEDTNTCNLLQNKYTIKSREHSSYTSNVSSFDVGLKIGKQKKKPLIIEPDSGVNIKGQPMPTGDVARDEPIYGEGTDGIAWKNPEYQNLWNRLPVKLKTALIPNKEWLTDFMYNFLVDKKKPNFTGFKLTIPKDLKIPPIKGANEQYDFGVKIYNDVFNKFPQSLKETYLTMYKEVDGIKNYDMLGTAVTDAVSKEVGLDRLF
jgi:hypothetical protein